MAGRILLWNYLYPGCLWPGHSRDHCPNGKPQWTLGSPHWCLSHYLKEPNWSHNQSWPRLCSPVHSTKWIGVQEENFLGQLQALGASSGDAHWVTTGFWGVQPLFFLVPSFAFKIAFWVALLRSFGQSFTRWSGLPCPKQLNHVGKMDNIPNWVIHSSNSTWGFWVLSI